MSLRLRRGKPSGWPRAFGGASSEDAAKVTEWLEEFWSPEEFARRLRIEFADDPMMWVSHETIYQARFVQGRGGLRRELSLSPERPSETPVRRGAGKHR